VPSGTPSAAPLYTISGNVKEDINDDNKGDENLVGVIIALADSAGKISLLPASRTSMEIINSSDSAREFTL
jgi:hypothetical protein